jgi:hypothetical protein
MPFVFFLIEGFVKKFSLQRNRMGVCRMTQPHSFKCPVDRFDLLPSGSQDA